LSALIFAIAPFFLPILLAKLLHVGSSSILGPAIAAITLGLVGHALIGPRLGRNARFASIGNGMSAAVMGACGYFISAQAVFYVTFALTIPTLLALSRIRERDIDPVRADGGLAPSKIASSKSLVGLFGRRSLLVLMACVLIFHFSNAGMLPLVGSEMATRSGQWATALVAACIVGPQVVVALISPTVGQLAQTWGRRLVLVFSFAALALRGAFLSWTGNPYLLVCVQLLDGISGAIIGVLVPLILADITRGTGRFNLGQGIVGSAGGIGAALSTVLAGYLADHVGAYAAFLGLTAIATGGLLIVLLIMPETKPQYE
jgi:predicted MFS family arabinose efflux permease